MFGIVKAYEDSFTPEEQAERKRCKLERQKKYSDDRLQQLREEQAQVDTCGVAKAAAESQVTPAVPREIPNSRRARNVHYEGRLYFAVPGCPRPPWNDTDGEVCCVTCQENNSGWAAGPKTKHGKCCKHNWHNNQDNWADQEKQYRLDR
jgi:hypothetical protein